jgi:hypothetical protein
MINPNELGIQRAEPLIPPKRMIPKLLNKDVRGLTALGLSVAYSLTSVANIAAQQSRKSLAINNSLPLLSDPDVVGKTAEMLEKLEIPDFREQAQDALLFVGGVNHALINMYRDPDYNLGMGRVRKPLTIMAAGALGIYGAHSIDAIKMNGETDRVHSIIRENQTAFQAHKLYKATALAHEEVLNRRISEVTENVPAFRGLTRLYSSGLSLSDKQSR